MRETPSGFSFVCTYSIEYAVPSVASGGGAKAEKAEQTKQSAPLKQGGRTLGGEDATTGFLLVFFFFRRATVWPRAVSPASQKTRVGAPPAAPGRPSKERNCFCLFFFILFSPRPLSLAYIRTGTFLFRPPS